MVEAGGRAVVYNRRGHGASTLLPAPLVPPSTTPAKRISLPSLGGTGPVVSISAAAGAAAAAAAASAVAAAAGLKRVLSLPRAASETGGSGQNSEALPACLYARTVSGDNLEAGTQQQADSKQKHGIGQAVSNDTVVSNGTAGAGVAAGAATEGSGELPNLSKTRGPSAAGGGEVSGNPGTQVPPSPPIGLLRKESLQKVR